MKYKLNKLKSKRYAAIIIIGLLLVFVVGLFNLLRPMTKNINIGKVLSKTTSLNASVLDGVSEEVTSNNYDEIKYQIRVDKSNSDEAVIVGTLSSIENKYARFKENKESVVTDNGKKITVTTKKSKVTITVIVENAPYGVAINPTFTINSVDESKSNIVVDPVTITGKSVEGKVVDEKGTLYQGIELGLKKNNEEVKRTYTRNDGEYVFSLGELDTYEIELEETKYKIVRFEDKTSDENKRILNIVIQEIEPFSLNIKKTISKLDLIVNGSKTTYTYEDVSTVVRNVKNAKTIGGSIYYNITIKNSGETKGTLTSLKDAIPDGLSFDADKNPGWTKDGNVLFYNVLEGKELDAFGKISTTLVLDIIKTDEAKNYINKAITTGEDYKYVAYYLNNKIYKEEYVVSSEKIQNINPNIENFDGWYTDRQYTNKYNFKTPVTKDTILFGKINNNKYSVTFIDKNPITDEETILDIVEVDENNSVDLIDNPEYRGYTFECFELNDQCYDFDEVTEDIVLYTKYTINNYTITYDLDGGDFEDDNPESYNVNDEFTISNPVKEGYTFIGWIGTDLIGETLNLKIEKGSIGDREYTACFEINRSTLTINPNGGTYLDSPSSVSYTENYGTVRQIVDSEKRGYEFIKYDKNGGGIYSNGTFTFNNDNAELTAVYEINTYTITYKGLTDDEKTDLDNPTTFTVENNSFTLNNPGSRKDENNESYEDFLGWDDGYGNVSSVVTIEKGSIDNRTYTAVWAENEDSYAIAYELNGGSLENDNPTSYKRKTESFTLNNPSKDGYDFAGWTGTGVTEPSDEVIIPKGSSGKRTYEAHYNIITYTISYEGLTAAERGDLNNPTSYNVETETFTLHNPDTRKDDDGNNSEDFLGWDDGKGNISLTVDIPKGSTGNKIYTAKWKENDDSYSIKYNLYNGSLEEGKTNPTSYTRATDDITLSNPSKAGYNFTGWTGTGLNSASTNVIIQKGSAGNRIYDANYQIITYTISYEGLTAEEKTNLSNPVSYNVETDSFTLANPGTRKDGDGNNSEDFAGWDDGSGTPSLIVTIPKGTIGNKAYTAVWRENTDSYSIGYNLNNGSLEEGKTNPTSYTRQTETFTLNNPSKAGYNFTGWTGTGLNSASTNVTIQKGSAGKRNYTANYQIITYTISYEGLTTEEKNILNNPVNYNVETNTITLVNPTRTGYTFEGWSGTGIVGKSVSVIIPKGSIENKEYTANFVKTEYTISYTLNGGSDPMNPTKYSIESEDIKLNNPTKTGYTFDGWTGTGVSEPSTNVIIPSGSIGVRSYLANYTPITYSITYDYDGGDLEEGKTNPSTYNIESENITFNSPIKEGYDFKNYKMGDSIITGIPTGTTGDISLKAYYEIKKYNITYYNESTTFKTEEVEWNSTATKPSNNPTKAHNIFLYWSLDGENEYDFSTLINEDKTLYAVYEEVESPEITFNPTLDLETNKTWVCGNSSNNDCGVTVTISSEHNDYDYYYSIGDGIATLYTEPFKVYENTQISAWSKKSDINSVLSTDNITNVDTTAPTINSPGTGAMSFNMTVSGTAQDAGSGVKKFTLYAKEKIALSFDDNLTYESEIFEGIGDHAENYDHTFYNVHENTEYIVKIVAEDYVGNISEFEVEVVTNPYVARVVGKNNILWYTVDPDTNEYEIEDGKEFLYFDSIQTAVDYCENVQCTIQTNPITPIVNESVTIGADQNITIDLDGRTITSNQSATFINNGKLQIVDRNPVKDGNNNYVYIGSVTNPINKAIINNGIFTLGDGSAEPSTVFIYPELSKPIIYGKQAAIEQNNIFYFFDGKPMSDVLSIISNGEDAITQYSYNVAITTEDYKNVATLRIVTDPEARIKSTYYAKLKVSSGDNAFDSSKVGTYSEENAKILSKIKQAAGYGFIYDAINDEIYNGNTSTASSTALSYVKIDLTDYDENQYIIMDMFADTYGSNSYGYVAITETLGDTSNQIVNLSGNNVTKSITYTLLKGKVYYVYFGFVKNRYNDNRYSNINPDETFKITNFVLTSGLANDKDNYSFVKQSNDSLISSNAGIQDSYSHSYIVYDLTEATGNYEFFTDVSISSENNDIGYIYISDNTSLQEPSNTEGRIAYLSGTQNNKTYSVSLEIGKINYVHFCYYKNGSTNSGSDSFTINSYSLSKEKTENLILESTFSHNSSDTYYFNNTAIYDINETSNKNINITVNGTTVNSNGDGMVFDGNDIISTNTSITNTNLTTETVVLDFSTTNTNLGILYMGSSKEKIAIGLYNQYLITANSSGDTFYLPGNWADGQKHKLIVIANGGSTYTVYFDGTALTKRGGRDYWSLVNDTTYVGGRSNGAYFNGTIYSVSVYDHAFDSSEVEATISDTGLLFRIDPSGFVRHDSYVSNNTGVANSVAHSYLTYDLTNENEDKYLYLDTSIGSDANRDYGYIILTDSPDTPTTYTNNLLAASGNLSNQKVIVTLKKNKMNYVHFIYKKDGSVNSYSDAFYIKEVRFYNTLGDVYKEDDHVVMNDTTYFEKPILNNEVDTIQILKPITLNTTIVVPENQEVVLDLNGQTLTKNGNDYIIKNNGNLKIIDSKYLEKKKNNQDYKLLQTTLFEAAVEQYLADLAEYEEYAGLCETCNGPSEEYLLDQTLGADFTYTGEAKTFVATYDAEYRIQVWGAQGQSTTSAEGGKGAYTEGIIELHAGDTLYVYVGGQGQTFNGGSVANSPTAGAYMNGSGASDIRLINGDWNNTESLASRIMVAAGGGGAGGGVAGGAGGTLTGIDGGTSNDSISHGGKGGTQTSGGAAGSGSYKVGAAGSFGKGANGTNYSAGGGGGYYGGGSSGVNYSSNGSGGGGSSYISGHIGSISVKSGSEIIPKPVCSEEGKEYECSVHYLEYAFTETSMVSGNGTMPTHDGLGSMVGNSGDGYVKITPIGIDDLKEGLDRTYRVKTRPLFLNYINDLELDPNVDKSTITPESEIPLIELTAEDLTGNITSTNDNVVLNEENAILNFNSGIINVNVNSKNGIVNRGQLIIGEDAIINANNSSTRGIFNQTNGDIVSFSGVINAVGASSIGLLNDSKDPSITNVRAVTKISSAVGIYNEALNDVTFENLDVSGLGIGFEEAFSDGDVVISKSNLMSSSSAGIYINSQPLTNKIIINTSGVSRLYVDPSGRLVVANSSNIGSMFNGFGDVTINSSTLGSVDNRGQTFINNSTLNGNGSIIVNQANSYDRGNTEFVSKLLLKNSIVNSTATSSTNVIDNHYYMTVKDTTFNNINNTKSTVFNNTPITGTPYLNISGNTTTAESFGTVIYNTGVVTVGTNEKDVKQEYEYGYTGKQEVFTAPEDGLYKLETWGASGGVSGGWSAGYKSVLKGGLGGYASGTISLHAGDKLYIHVGGHAEQDPYASAYYGSYNGGGIQSGTLRDWANGSGGGATDISLSDEDNTWYYDNGVSTSKRSTASYNQRILVAGGGGACLYDDNQTNCAGGVTLSSSTTNALGYGANSGGGGYYGGINKYGGSSYASNTLTNVVFKKGTEEMPDYSTSGLIRGNYGTGYAKITLIDSNEGEKVVSTPILSSTNYGVNGSGRFIYYDGTINSNIAVASSIEKVPDNYDIYLSEGTTLNEKMVLIPNADSRPVTSGEEFVAAIGDAKFTTIQNAIDASNNGDEIDLLVDINQQNTITIPNNKIVTIDYNGHNITSYSSDTLFNNSGNLTIIDSLNSKKKNIFHGDKYIYNTGTMIVKNLYIDNYTYTAKLIENLGNLSLEDVKLELGHNSVSGRNGIINRKNAIMNIKNSTLNLIGDNDMVSNYGDITLTNNTITSNNGDSIVRNNELGVVLLDGNSYSVSGNDYYGRFLLYNQGTSTIKNMSTILEDIYNSNTLTLEGNNIPDSPSGSINSTETGLVIINSGTYNNTINIGGTGRTIDSTNNLYSLIMNDGTINKTLNISSSAISSIKGGIIKNTSGYAINNTGPGVINLGIKDSTVSNKETTRPSITGSSGGINTTNASLIVNFYDGIITGQKAYNVTIGEVENGYSIHLDIEDNKEIKYLTNEPMFRNVTQNVLYNSVSDINDKISNGLINDNDVIEVTRDITITNLVEPITIPSGLTITFDLNDFTVDKNNQTMFDIYGELVIINSNQSHDSTLGRIDSTNGTIFNNNSTLRVNSGIYISEQSSVDNSVIKNNQGGTLYVSDGTFTKYYDRLDHKQSYSGEIINNSGIANVSGGTFYSNGSYVECNSWYNGYRSYIYASTVFLNNATGTLNVTGGNYDGITSKNWNDYNGGYTNNSTTNKGSLIYNYGTATISDIVSNNSHIGVNEGTLTFDNVTMNNIVTINNLSYPNLMNRGTLSISDSQFTIKSSFVDNYSGNITINNTTIDRLENGPSYRADEDNNYYGFKNSHVIRNTANTNGENVVNIIDSTIYNKGSGEVIENRSKLNVESSTIQASNNTSINSYSALLNVTGDSEIISLSGTAIYVNYGTFNLGKSIEEDHVVSKTYPMIKGTTYGVTNNSNTATFNFYDGLLMGKTDSESGIITHVEPGYGQITGTSDTYKTKYLDRIKVIKNVTQSTANNEVSYYDLKTAFDYAHEGDTLQMIADYNNLTIDETAVVDVNITFDLNGKTIKQSNNILFTVNSRITLIDSSSNNTGNIISLVGSEMFDNYGTIILSDAKISTSNNVLLVKNNTGSTLTISDNGKIDSSNASLLIDNSGTVNIYNGAYLHTMNSCAILNRNILNITDLNNDDDPNTTSSLTAPWIYSQGNGYGQVVESYETATIKTLSGGVTTIYGGIFNNGVTYSTGNPGSSKFINNYGTTTIKNLENYSFMIGSNSGTLNIENSNFYNAKAGFLYSGSVLNMKNVTIEITDKDTGSGIQNRMYFVGSSTLDNVTITERNNGLYDAELVTIYGTSIIKNSSISYRNSTNYAIVNNGDLTFKNTTISSLSFLRNNNKVTFDEVTATTSGYVINNQGTATIENNSSVTSTENVAINNNGTVNVKDTSSIISQNGPAIYLYENGIVNIGEIGGEPSILTPYIEGTTFGINKTSQTSSLNFYDGLIVGKTGPNAISGGVTNVEGGYETENIIETNPEDQNDKTYKEYLVLSASSVAVAKVGTYTFTSNSEINASKALQNAINFAIGDGSNVKNVDLITNVDLTADEVNITASEPVTINLNGFIITENANYKLSSNITQNSNNNLGASISKVFADIFDITNKPKDIIIYELSDGSSLDTSKTYKLYKDGKLVSLEKEELGKYKYKGNNEKLTPIKGRLYLDNLYNGSYRLVSSDNKSIEFSIDEDGNISGNVTENVNDSNSTSAISNSQAELILSIQTGVFKIYYLIFIIPILIVTVILILLNRKKKEKY